jgi:hypothetical protein
MAALAHPVGLSVLDRAAAVASRLQAEAQAI